MKKLFLLVVVLTALTVFCSAAIAQNGYVVPTLETVRRDGSTVNVFTYRDGNGNTFRTIEYYVNDDGSYGNLDLYYGSNGLISFKVQTDYKNGVCTVGEQSISYSADNLATVNMRETTFNPDGNVDVLTYTIQELENDSKVVTGMETDGQGRKICDFKEEYYKDAENNQASRRTVYHPNKTVEVIHRTSKQDGSEICNEWIYDENDNELYSLYSHLDAQGKELLSDATKYAYGKDGQVTEEHLITDGETDTRLSYIEKWQENGSSSTAEGELQDKDGNKLADYSFEKTLGKGESEVTVATFIYPNGRVDILTKTVDEKGNLSIQEQLDFQAAGEKTEETPDDDFKYENFYKRSQNELPGNDYEPDDELIRYFEAINDIWGEVFDGDIDSRDEEFVLDPDDAADDSVEGPVETGADSEDRNVTAASSEDLENDDEAADSKDRSDDDDGGSDIGTGDNGDSYDWSGNDGGFYDWSSDDGDSYDWSSDDGGSDNWNGDDGDFGDWDGDDGSSEDWDGDDGDFEDWDGDDSGSED